MPGRGTAFVTGAAGGLGREVAAQLAEAGFDTFISSRRPDDACATASAIGAHALTVPLDVTDPQSVSAATVELERRTEGRLDALVNNAAGYVDWTETGTGAALDAAHQVMETNLFGAWRMTQALLPLLRRSPAGRVVNISSGAGSHGDTVFGLTARGGAAATYGISKAALNALTATLAANLESSDILVNAVCPGLTATYPGAEEMGARPPAESAKGVVWAATLPVGGPNGGLFRDQKPLAW